MSQLTGQLKIDACFSPLLYPTYHEDSTIVVIIDILRATSAICTALHHGAEKIIPVATIEEAMEYKKRGYLTGAERDAIPLNGFDFGNSPFSYMGDNVKGKTIAMTTTNGTQAIHAARDAYQIVIGSFLNLKVLTRYLIGEKRDVLLLCSGWKNKFNLEDALFAGAVTEEILSNSDNYKLGDACLALKYLYAMAKDSPYKFLNYSYHKERLARLNLKKDIKYCLTPNQTNVIPVLKDGALVNLTKVEVSDQA